MVAKLTPSQVMERARAVKAASKGIPKRDLLELRNNFADDWYWMELCKRAGYNLPHWGTVATKGKLTTWIHRLGISYEDYEKDQGKLQSIIDDNPDWPLRSFVGLMLEYKFDKEAQR